MNRDVDPLSELTARLADALTTNRVRVQSGDGAIVVEATARGRVRVQLDDGALRTTGTDLSGALNELIARAVAEAQESAQGALAQFRADPRVGEAIANTTDAMQLPEPASELPDSESKAAEATSTEPERLSPPSRPAYSADNSDPDVETFSSRQSFGAQAPHQGENHAVRAAAARRRAQEEFDRQLEYEQEVEENEQFFRRTFGGGRE